MYITSNSRAFKTKHFDINLMKFGGLLKNYGYISIEYGRPPLCFLVEVKKLG